MSEPVVLHHGRGETAQVKLRRGRQLQQLVGVALEAFDVVEPAQLFVEGRERDMTGFAGGLEHHAIREAEFRAATESSQGSGDHIWILDDEVTMVEQHVDSGREVLVVELEDCIQHPNHLDQDDVRNPRALGHKRLGPGGLPRVVPCQEANHNVGVNGAHIVWPRHGVGRPSNRPETCEKRPSEKARSESLLRNGHQLAEL